MALHYNVAYYQPALQGDVSLADFERDLLFLLNDVARLLRVDADKRARAHGMTRAQWGILIWLERQPGISQKELAELLEVEPITVARLIDRLEARGMVERRPDPRDRRIWRLHLCLPAHLVLREINHQRAEMAAMVANGIDNDNLATMIEALVRMKATLTRDSHPSRRASESSQSAEPSPTGQSPIGQHPPGQHPPGQPPSGQRPEGQHPAEQRPAGRRPVGSRPRGPRPGGPRPGGPRPVATEAV
jgi:MarR family transcriptional regulator, transcriptional regulator for hemolysin